MIDPIGRPVHDQRFNRTRVVNVDFTHCLIFKGEGTSCHGVGLLIIYKCIKNVSCYV